MTEEKDLRLSYDEVTRVSLECKCGAELIFDLNQDQYKDPKYDWPHKNFPCALCGRQFDSAIKPGLLALSQWLTEVGKLSDVKVCFRIRRGAVS